MSSPAISVVLPVYNSAPYLAATIDSLLAQTFTGFELIVINDGSTDESISIIKKYNDPRIRLIDNPLNKGLIATLNEGITLANGKYIARIDGDDIAVTTRFEKQLECFVSNPALAVVASTVKYIDKDGRPAGTWPTDRETISYDQILAKMPWENCIAHPSVMIRADIAKQYRYSAGQVHTEDYDLWLRLLADGNEVQKIAEPLLLYRVHDSSITGSILRKTNPFFKQYRCKKTFLEQRRKQHRWGKFENKVLQTTVFDGVMGLGKNIKNMLRN